MALFSIEILGLTPGTPKGSDQYVAVDVTDPTMATVGTDKKYQLANIYSFILHGLGFIVLPPCDAASTGAYVATYNNGIGGINATLTDASGTFAPFTIDGIPGVVSSLTTPTPYLIKNQANPAQNGIYLLTQNGDGISKPWILIRASYFNSPANIINLEVTTIIGGITQADTTWQLNAPGPIVVGTTAINWVAFALLSSFLTIPIEVQFGGTGNTSFTPFALITGGTTPTGALQSVSGTGLLNQVLVSNGPGALPSWQNVPGLVPAALTEVNDTNVTMTLGGTPATALLQAVSMTLGWTGQLATPRGGTGLNAPTVHNLLIGNGASALTLLPPSATSGIPLISQGLALDPAYGTAVVAGGGTGNTTFTAFSVICAGTTATGPFQNVVGLGSLGQILTSQGAGALPIWATPAASGTVNPGLINEIAYYAASGNAVSPISPTQNDGVLVTSNTGVPSILAGPGSSNHVLMSNAAAAPSWSVPTYPNASATLNHFIISDGTNFIASSSALNLAGDLSTTGAFTVNFTFTNNTSVTFPTTGTLATTSQVINWNNVTSTPISLIDNNGYIVNNGGVQVVFNLPATAPIGQRFLIVGHDAGGWKIAQSNVNQNIHFGNVISTVGLAGFIESTDGNDCVELICTATDNEFTVRNAVGNITVS